MQFELFKDETQYLVDLVSNNEWRYHSGGIPQRYKVKKAIKNGYYSDGRKIFC